MHNALRSLAPCCVLVVSALVSVPAFPVGAGQMPQPGAIELPASLLDWPTSVSRPRFSPDGTRIAFASAPDGVMNLYVADVATGAIEQVTDSSSLDDRPAWAPDGGRLVFHSDRAGSLDLWVIELLDGNQRRLTDLPGTEATADWSGTGEWITFVSEAEGSWDVWMIRPDGSDRTRVTSHSGNEYHPKFSPDSRRIVFYPTWHGWTDIAVVEIASGEVTELLSSEHEDFRPYWSPDGRWIAMASDRGTGRGLWVMPAEGGDPALLVRSERGVDFPDWSPDGSTILYLAETRHSHLFEFDLATSTRRQVTRGEGVTDQYPDISPDGRTLIYESDRYDNEENVVLRDRVSGAERRISTGRILDSWPRFSPDGSRIAYTHSGGDQADADLFVMTVTDGIAHQWTERGNVAFPTFCGDSAVVFAWGPIAYGSNWQLWHQVEGQTPRRIGDFEIERSGLDCAADGSRVLVSLLAGSEGGPRLAWVDPASGSLAPLTSGTAAHMHPRLSPDGEWVTYSATGPSGSAAYVVPAIGGEPRELFTSELLIGAVEWVDDDTLIFGESYRLDAARTLSVPARFRPR